MRSESVRYLIVPGWKGSPAAHWQSHWQSRLPDSARVEQADWLNPRREQWIAELDHSIAMSTQPVILVAHSLGCITIAHWAMQASVDRLQRVRGALLVAPADVQRDGCPDALRNFAPIPRQVLPFPSLLVGSDNDAAATACRAAELGTDWGSDIVILSGVGHINTESGHSRWEQGFAYLYRLQNRIVRQDRKRA
ncbi:alpha/beta hydrolase [Stutzerimonas stutzeri]|uniref:Alpha/beta hydrolase n=1 Tax=Stutzerimonas stutzeri TaxID=316 RepID=W8QWY0_STUST|nr:alpha/beta hydrolase [Stutzerimonas stutzeri]AHL75115.1 alpha/beta hydrolase [Stutzerimonas stutzeri]MCQ4328339.1 alpha/beta hydrolase [Stutzerimonas stutzeri]